MFHVEHFADVRELHRAGACLPLGGVSPAMAALQLHVLQVAVPGDFGDGPEAGVGPGELEGEPLPGAGLDPEGVEAWGHLGQGVGVHRAAP